MNGSGFCSSRCFPPRCLPGVPRPSVREVGRRLFLSSSFPGGGVRTFLGSPADREAVLLPASGSQRHSVSSSGRGRGCHTLGPGKPGISGVSAPSQVSSYGRRSPWGAVMMCNPQGVEGLRGEPCPGTTAFAAELITPCDRGSVPLAYSLHPPTFASFSLSPEIPSKPPGPVGRLHCRFRRWPPGGAAARDVGARVPAPVPGGASGLLPPSTTRAPGGPLAGYGV